MQFRDVAPRLRVGVVVDDLFVSKYVLQFLRQCQARQELEVTHIVVARPKDLTTASGGPSVAARGFGVAQLLFRVIVLIERVLLLRNKRHHDHLQKVDVRDAFPNIIVREITALETSPTEIAELDLFVAFSAEEVGPELQCCPKKGLIVVSHSTDYTNKATLSGFWEVYFRRDVTGFSITRFRPEDSTTDILMRGQVGTEFYYLLNQASLFEKSTYYLAKMVERVACDGKGIEPKEKFPLCRFPRAWPGLYQNMIYLGGLAYLVAMKAVEKRRGYKFHWNVAFLHEDWRNAELWRSMIIQNPPGRFLADPFVISRNGKAFCFVEDCEVGVENGQISVYELKRNDADFVGVAIQESFHLSYPYLFEYQGELYMCPESSANRDIRIYKCIDFPLRWQFVKSIMKDISAVDSMLFEKNGKWWMLTNVDPAGWEDYSLELHLFSSASPLDTHWMQHPANPIYTDSLRARNGGMVKEGNRNFRVAQSKGFDMYGKQTSVNEIMDLTDDAYVETCVGIIAPAFKEGMAGTHHLHGIDHVTVIDFAHDSA